MGWAESKVADRIVGAIHDALLACLRPFRAPLALGGVDYDQLRAVLSAKLRTDLRPRQGSDAGYGLMAAGLAATMLFELAFGMLLSVFLKLDPSAAEFATLVQLAVMSMVAFPLLLDFDSVLTGGRDERALEGLPISERTRLAVRLTHTLAYVGSLSLPLALPPLVFGCVSFPALRFGPAFCVATVLAVSLTVALVTGLFGLGLRVLGPRRFRQAVVGLQLGAVVTVLGLIQLGAVTGGTEGFFVLLSERSPWQLLLPPAHFGGLVSVALGSRAWVDLALAGCALALPPALLAAAVRALGGQALREAALATPAAEPVPAPSAPPALARAGLERAGYTFVRRMTRRERGYRMGAWTATAAYVPIGLGAQWSAFVRMDDPALILLVLPAYTLMAVAPTQLFHLRFSDDHAGRWLFDGLSRRQRAEFKAGGVKAVMYGAIPWLLPPFFAAPLFAFGWRAVPQLVLAAVSVLAWNLVLAPLFLRPTPFSRAPSRAEAQGTLLGFLFVSVMTLVAGGLHALLQLHPAALGVGCALAAAALFVLHARLAALIPSRN
ncbi:MAG: hypothetical protein AAF682_04165 [Planctomycetota bacterium]